MVMSPQVSWLFFKERAPSRSKRFVQRALAQIFIDS
jgi:hypothetical protein